MRLRRPRLRHLAGASLTLGLLLGYFAVQAGTAAPAFAATSQFHGVNWADPNDNFITGPNVPVGLSQSDSYSATYTKATAILKGFQSLGANTVRFGINAATTSSSWWNSYTAAFDAATALGMNVIICPWLQNGTISDTTSFYQMWDTVINKYGGSSNFYFDIMNEPYAMSATQLTSTAATWLARYPSVPARPGHRPGPVFRPEPVRRGFRFSAERHAAVDPHLRYVRRLPHHRAGLDQRFRGRTVRLLQPGGADRVRGAHEHRRQLRRPPGRQ